MKATSIIAGVFSLCGSFLLAQNENTKWYFGNHAGLDFMTNPPTPLTNSANNSMYGCSSIADAAGNLLFYTDGATVYDQSHSIMANGTGLGVSTNTNTFNYQYSAIVKQPGNANTYYIFTNGHNGGTLSGVYYSVVDMSLAAGMGSVTIKNATVSTAQPSGQMALAQHCNGTDVWLLSHDYGNTNFRCFLITAAGINLSPIISSVGLNGAASSYMKVSRSGKKIASTYNSSYLTLYDFDASTAIISNTLAITTNSDGAYFNSMEFSPDGTKLYCSVNQYMNNRVAQWNVCAGSGTAIIASQYTIAATDMGAGLQLGPDGKIYVGKYNQTSLGVINNPDAQGAACNYVNTGLSIAPGMCRSGLPSFVSRRLPAPPFTYTAVCQTISYAHAAISNTTIANCGAFTSLVSHSWDFGDPLTAPNNTSTLQSPTHQYSGIGTYTTTLVLHYNCYNDTLRQVVNVTTPNPAFAVSGPTAICKGNAAVFTATAASAYTYSWSSGATTSSISVTPTANINYTTICTNSAGCTTQQVVQLVVSKCTSIDNTGEVLEHVAVFPNPTSGILNIEFEPTSETGAIEILISDQLGKMILSKKTSLAKEEIDLSTWAKGIYFLKIKSGEKTVMKKLLVE